MRGKIPTISCNSIREQTNSSHDIHKIHIQHTLNMFRVVFKSNQLTKKKLKIMHLFKNKY